MATPDESTIKNIDWDAVGSFIGGFIKPKVDYTKPYRVGERKYHKSPGHRSWSEVWVHPRPATRSEDGYWYKHCDDHVTHQGTDHIWHAEFWEEVEMVTGTEATVEEIRGQMGCLDAEAVEAGYRHYYDKWTWEDASERTRRLMLAFEAEHQTPSGMRAFDKARAFVEKETISKLYYELYDLKNNIIIDDSPSLINLELAY